jgi:hypothetical protein
VESASGRFSRLEQELIHPHVRIGNRFFFDVINGCYLEFFRIKKKEIIKKKKIKNAQRHFRLTYSSNKHQQDESKIISLFKTEIRLIPTFIFDLFIQGWLEYVDYVHTPPPGSRAFRTEFW